MQQDVERDNRAQLYAMGLRVGVGGGEVTSEDDFFGETVVEAARLCATADGGQILVADVVRAMAGRRSPHQCRSRCAPAIGRNRPAQVVFFGGT